MCNLDLLRKKIDKIDTEFVSLFEERMNIISEILKYKYQNNIPILDSDREKEILIKNIAKLKNGDFATYLELFFENIMYLSRKYQSHKM